MIHNDGEDKNMTDDELKALVGSLAIDKSVSRRVVSRQQTAAYAQYQK